MKVLIYVKDGRVETVFVEGESEPVGVVVEEIDGKPASRPAPLRPLEAAPDWLASMIE